MKLPPSIRLPLCTLCTGIGGALIAGFARDWPLALLGAIAITIALCWLVRAAYAQGHVDALVPRPPGREAGPGGRTVTVTLADVAQYARKLRRS